MSSDKIKQNEWENRLAFIDGMLDLGEEKQELPVAEALQQMRPKKRSRPRKRRTNPRWRRLSSYMEPPTDQSEFGGSIADRAKAKVAARVQDFAAELLRKEAVSLAVMLYREAKQSIDTFFGDMDDSEGNVEVNVEDAFEISEMFITALRFFEMGNRTQDAIEIRGVLAIWYSNVILPMTDSLEGKITVANEIADLANQVINASEDGELELPERMRKLLKRPEIANLL
jgi:hypothetical protein